MTNKFCTPIDKIPKILEKFETILFDIYAKNLKNFIAYGNKDGRTQILGSHIGTGFGFLPLNKDSDSYHYANQMLRESGIYIRSSQLGIQRCWSYVPPHTDPGRAVSLLYHLKGPAITDFYLVDDFIPDIDYTNRADLRLVESVEMDLKKWYLFNNASIHSVRKIKNFERVTFSVNFVGIFDSYDYALGNLDKVIFYDR